MSRNKILINSSHYKGGNLYEYPLTSGIDLTGYNIKLEGFSMYNSTFNISSALGNNRISVIWITGVTYNYIIPDGYYSMDDLNLFLNFCMLGDNLYVNSSNSPVFFINVSANAVLYSAQINVNYVPTSSEASTLGYTIPHSAWSFPANPVTPQLVLGSDSLKNIFGFQNGQNTFPLTPQTTNQQFISSGLSILSPTYTIILTCNLLNSNFSNVPTLLHQIPIDVSFGALIKYENSVEDSVAIATGKPSSIRIQLWNQDMVPLQFKDYQTTITLSIEKDTNAILLNTLNMLQQALTSD